jgi:prepilin-type N-terminal cleavage/methylation domain-containing protein
MTTNRQSRSPAARPAERRRSSGFARIELPAVGRGFSLIERLACRPNPCEVSAKQRRKQIQAAFTLIELLVVIAIISLLVSILLPSLQRARDLAKVVACQSNLRAIGMGEAMYIHDNDGHLPPGDAEAAVSPRYWDTLLVHGGGSAGGYVGDVEALRCPGDTTPVSSLRSPPTYSKRSYSCNEYFHGNKVWGRWPPKRQEQILRPSTTMTIVDTWTQENVCFFGWFISVCIPRHHDVDSHQEFTRTNELYFDGHSENLAFDEYLLIPGAPNYTDPLFMRHYFGQ